MFGTEMACYMVISVILAEAENAQKTHELIAGWKALFKSSNLNNRTATDHCMWFSVKRNKHVHVLKRC